MKIHIILLILIVFALVDCKKKRKKKRKEIKKMYDTPVVGIDLGTTFSCVSIYRPEIDSVEIIPNLVGGRTTPSVVAWNEEGELVVGSGAKILASRDPLNTFYDVKRFIGRSYNEVLKIDRDLVSYKLINKNNRLLIQRNKSNSFINYNPEQISAFVLAYLKESAEQYLGTPINHAVITVPAYFNDKQRTSTMDAGKIAGLNVVRIINEPTAASMAYGRTRKFEHNILVFDLGGGTFDVSLLTIADGIYEVVATAGDMHLGGEDFDLRIVNYLSDVWKKKHPELEDFRKNEKAFQRVKQACERTKIALSSDLEADVYVENLAPGVDLQETITRSKFEQLNMDLFKKVLKPVQSVLDDSGVSKREIREIVLVGGSTRIPKVQSLISGYFNNKELHKELNPDEAVAYGAAIQAGIIDGVIKDELLVDVIALSLGVETVGKVMSIIIPKQTQLPTEKSEMYTTSHTNQDMIKIPVFEGESRFVAKNRKLGEFELHGIPAAPKGVPKIKITFQIDQNGILKVTAEEKRTGAKVEGIIEKGDLTPEQVEEMKQNAEAGKEDDLNYLKTQELLSKFGEFLGTTYDESISKEVAKRFNKKNRKKISRNIAKMKQWFLQYQRIAKYEKLKEQFIKFRNYICPILDIDIELWSIEDIERKYIDEKEEYDESDEPEFDDVNSEEIEKETVRVEVETDANVEAEEEEEAPPKTEEINLDEDEL